MMKTEQKQMVWMELYLAVVKRCEEDLLGSVTRIYNSSGTAVFSAEYDPWGALTVTTNSIGYNRGYCGHEMLNDLQAINMRSATSGDAFVTKWRKNGWLYDPYIARFLSPDRSALCDAFIAKWRKNYVQLPTSAQSFNRYSYCLNNPLKYTDPSGELFGIGDDHCRYVLHRVLLWWPPPVRGIIALFSAYESRYGHVWKTVLDLY